MNFFILLSLIVLNYQMYKLLQLLILIDEQRADIDRFRQGEVGLDNGK